MSLLARCPDCSKTYRVPHGRREWNCKECEGVLILDSKDCPTCGAVAVGGESFCEECGTALEEGAEATRRQADKEDRKVASGEMHRAMKRIDRLSTILTLNFYLSLLGAVYIVVVALGGRADRTTLLIAGVFQTIVVVLSWLCMRQVRRRPLPVVVTLASFQTLSALWGFLDGDASYVSAGYCALLWMLTVDAAHATRLAKQFPDLYLAKRMRGEHLRGKTRGGDSIVSQRRASERVRTAKERKQRVLVLAGVLGAVVIAVVGYRILTAEDPEPTKAAPTEHVALPSPDEAIERFRAAWNASDLAAMTAMVKPSLQSKMRRTLGSLGGRYGWEASFPTMGEARVTLRADTTVKVLYTVGDGEFGVRFMGSDGEWVVRTITASGLEGWQDE